MRPGAGSLRRRAATMGALVAALVFAWTTTAAAATPQPTFAVENGQDWVCSARVRAGDDGWSPFFGPGVVVWDGGSIVGGSGAPAGLDLASQTLALVPRVCDSYESITPSADIVDMLVEAAGEVDARYLAGADSNLCVVQGGATELKDGARPSTVFDNVQAYCEGRRNAGFKVVVLTLLPRSDVPSYEPARATYNEMLRDGWRGFADGLADVGADARIGDPLDNLDRRYYRSDGKHPNTAGYAVMAAVTAPVLNALDWQSAATLMRLRNEGEAWGDWRPYAAGTTWWLADGDGAKSVEAQYRKDIEDPVTVADTTNVDTVRPVTEALGKATVRRGRRAVLTYRVVDPAPCGPVATVVHRFVRGGKVVRQILRRQVAVNTRQSLVFTCGLPRGRYVWKVTAVDTAGNPQRVVGTARLTVR